MSNVHSMMKPWQVCVLFTAMAVGILVTSPLASGQPAAELKGGDFRKTIYDGMVVIIRKGTRIALSSDGSLDYSKFIGTVILQINSGVKDGSYIIHFQDGRRLEIVGVRTESKRGKVTQRIMASWSKKGEKKPPSRLTGWVSGDKGELGFFDLIIEENAGLFPDWEISLPVGCKFEVTKNGKWILTYVPAIYKTEYPEWWKEWQKNKTK